MDTKLKKRKPALTFVFFFLSMSAILAGIIFAVFTALGGSPMPAFDYKNTKQYTGAIDNLLHSSWLVATGQQYDVNESLLAAEQSNIAYYIIDDEGNVFTSGEDTTLSANEFVARTRISQPPGSGNQVISDEVASSEVAASELAPTTVNYEASSQADTPSERAVGFDEQNDGVQNYPEGDYEDVDFEDWADNRRDSFVPDKVYPDSADPAAAATIAQDVDMHALFSEYSYSGAINTSYEHFVMMQGDRYYEETFDPRTGSYTSHGDSISQSPYTISRLGMDEGEVVCIAVRRQSNLQNSGMIYSAYYSWYKTAVIYVCIAALMGLSVLVLLITLLKYRSLSLATSAIGRAMGRVWIEPKIIATFLAISITLYMLLTGGISYNWPMVIALLVADLWWFWLCMIDLSANGGKTFTHNIFNSARHFLEQLEGDLPVLTRLKRRPVIIACAEIVILLLLFVLFCFNNSFLSMLLYEDPLLIAGMVIAAALWLFLLMGYLQRHSKNVDELGRAMSYAEQIKNGTASAPLTLTGDFAGLAENLNDIQGGISRAVDNQTRSERMKVELITNVSHDLKTPLTSIMNYIDLLGQEVLSPEHANDYVKVLAQKSERLKNMIQDLFDVSKAHSGATELHPERIDTVALAEQTVAELDKMISEVGVDVKTSLSPQPLYVFADGGKLHRVFENLLGNALKYSLTGTRVYVDVRRSGETAEISFKNVAGYEMTFTADEIVERFQRGDTSRSTDGSGLGLAIAKSFLELCGGTLRIELDGDLFKAIVNVPLCGDVPPSGPRPITPQAPPTPTTQPGPKPQERPQPMPQTQPPHPQAQPQPLQQPAPMPQTQPPHLQAQPQPVQQPAPMPQTQPPHPQAQTQCAPQLQMPPLVQTVPSPAAQPQAQAAPKPGDRQPELI